MIDESKSTYNSSLRFAGRSMLLVMLCSLFFMSAYSQEQEETQFDSTVLEVQPLIKLNKDGGIMRNVAMIANVRFALNNDFKDGQYISSQFKSNDLRLELRGKITDRLEFRFRDVITRSAADAATVDLIRRSVDLAYISYELTPKITIVGGKMFAEYGGYEIFYNPITMFVYNDWIANGDIFLAAVKASYHFAANHTLNIQMANSSSRSFSDNYGTTPGASEAKAPFGFTVNWNGKVGNSLYTKWSYSRFTLTKGEFANTLVLGTRYKKTKFVLEYDFKYSNEDLDKTGIVSRLIGNEFTNRVRDARYLEHWARFDYFFSPVISATLIGMVSDAYWAGNTDSDAGKTSLLKTLWTVSPRVEYRVNQKHNTKLFIGYVGKFTKYTSYAQGKFGLTNTNASQILVGFTSQFVVL